MSGYARKFAQKPYTLNIFIMSMCRIPFGNTSTLKFLEEDAFGRQNVFKGYP